MRLALYGGTFDPIHHGHLILARDAIEQFALDRVIFIPAALSPHKLPGTPAPAAVRCEMIASAIFGEPHFALEECELRRAGPSFSIDTVEKIQAENPDAQLHCLIGADNLPELHTWRRIDDLRRLAQLLVFTRGAAIRDSEYDFPTLPRRVDISSTQIRRRVALGQTIRYFVPEPVREIIAARQLYQEPPHRI